METRGGAFSVSNRMKLYAVMERLVEDEVFRREAGARAEAVVRENAGATERTLEQLLDRFPKIFSGGKD
jgi:3-deoxy-D-manno-octulosonic-acid transferase